MPTTPQKTRSHRPTLFVSINMKATMAAARPTQDTITLPSRALEILATVKKSGKGQSWRGLDFVLGGGKNSQVEYDCTS